MTADPGRHRSIPAAGPARLVRTVVLGGSSLLLGAAAHVLGGGRLPSVGVLTVTAVLLGVVAVVATARRVRFAPLLALLGVEQLLLHAWFGLSAAVAGCTTASAVPAASHHGGLPGPAGCTVLPGHAGVAMDTGGAGMWALHAAAVLATAWLLARGEAWLWRVADHAVAVATRAPRLARRPREVEPTVRRPVLVPGGPGWSPSVPRGPPRWSDVTSPA